MSDDPRIDKLLNLAFDKASPPGEATNAFLLAKKLGANRDILASSHEPEPAACSAPEPMYNFGDGDNFNECSVTVMPGYKNLFITLVTIKAASLGLPLTLWMEELKEGCRIHFDSPPLYDAAFERLQAAHLQLPSLVLEHYVEAMCRYTNLLSDASEFDASFDAIAYFDRLDKQAYQDYLKQEDAMEKAAAEYRRQQAARAAVNATEKKKWRFW